MVSDKPITPVLLAFVSALLWGIWWIPIRRIEAMGLDGAWGSVAMNLGALAIGLVWLALARNPPRIGAKSLTGAALVGVAVATYSVAFTMGDVIRVVLLFYLAPAWSKIIEWAFLKRGWHWSATLTITASLAGAYLVLGGRLSLSAVTVGDALAVLSGMSWAVGATLIFTDGRASPVALSCASALSAILIGLGFILLGQGTAFSGSANWTGGMTGAVFGVIYVLPVLVLTLWAAQRLSPAVITFLLTAEILSGVISAALLLDEPFGWMQAGGAALILMAAMAEVVAGTVKRQA